MNGFERRRGVSVVAVAMIVGCGACFSDVENVLEGSPVDPVVDRSVSYSMGAFGVVARVGAEGPTFELSMHFPRERVHVLGNGEAEQLESVYKGRQATAPYGASGSVAFHRLRHPWGDSQLDFSVVTDSGVHWVRWSGGPTLAASSSGLSTEDLVRQVEALLRADGPVARAVVPAIRMEQLIGGEWHNLRHYAGNTFMHFVAPSENSRVRVTIVPLLACYYADRVEIGGLPEDLVSGVEFEIGEGFEGVPAPLDVLVGTRLVAGKPVELPFPLPLGTFSPDLTVVALISGADERSGALVGGRSDWDVFDSQIPLPTGISPPGSETYQTLTYRSEGLATLLDHAEGAPWYPPSDDEFPEWVRDHFGY